MSIQPIAHEPTPEELRERATDLLDRQLDVLVALLGPIAMQALVAGRVLRAQRKMWGSGS